MRSVVDEAVLETRRKHSLQEQSNDAVKITADAVKISNDVQCCSKFDELQMADNTNNVDHMSDRVTKCVRVRMNSESCNLKCQQCMSPALLGVFQD